MMLRTTTWPKEYLENEYAQLQAQIDGLHSANSQWTTFERGTGIALQNTLECSLEQVENALHRFQMGTYGLCEVCGEPINPERLRAFPRATMCVTCKRHRDNSHDGILTGRR